MASSASPSRGRRAGRLACFPAATLLKCATMPLWARSLPIMAIALVLAGCATSPRLAVMDADIHIQGKLLSVEPAPSCGFVLFGSPATYQVLAGPEELRGKRIRVLVACIEMPLVEGDLRSFTVGATHYLVITRENVRRVELPARLAGRRWFYLKAASPRELRPDNPFKP